jgi:hypothetical protein
MKLINLMAKDEISTPEKIAQLKAELGVHFSSNKFAGCNSMGDIVKTNLKHMLQKNLSRIQEAKKRYS